MSCKFINCKYHCFRYHKSMPRVTEIGITKDFKKKMQSVKEVVAIAGKGLVGDRYFKNDNENRIQITIIENENIEEFNKISKSFIPAISFRRNIITKNISLNKLVGTEFMIGEVKIKAHDLCRPCKYLQESLMQKNLIKELLLKGGLRCEILTNGKIFVGDKIKV